MDFKLQWERISMYIKNMNRVYVSMFLSFFLIDVLLRIYCVDFMYLSNAFTFAWIILIMSVITSLPIKYEKNFYICIYIIVLIYTCAQYIYFAIFDKFFWIKDAIVAKEGTAYGGYVLNTIDFGVISIFFVGIASMMICSRYISKQEDHHKQSYKGHLCAFILSGMVLCMLPSFLSGNQNETTWDGWKNQKKLYYDFTNQNRNIEISGIYHFLFRDLYHSLFVSDVDYTETYEELDAFFEEKKEFVQNEYSGIFKGKNIIFVMMESMDNFLITETYTPALQYMSEHGINFNQHHAAIFGAGGTFNTEFTSLTGYHSPNSGNAAYEFSNHDFSYSLPNVMSQEGYFSKSFHFNQGSYYNRRLMHSALGFQSHISLMDMGIDEDLAKYDSYMVEDHVSYNLMVDETPFFDFLITYSAHLPYSRSNNICKTQWNENKNLVDENLSVEENCIYLQAKETDDFFKSLLKRLYDDDLLENTVIVAYTDHIAYGLQDNELLDSLNKQQGDVLNERVPFIIFDYESDMRLNIDKVTNSTDILPTVLNLMGIKPSVYYLGNDALDEVYSGYVFFSDGSWFDGTVHYHDGSDVVMTNTMKEMNTNIAKRIDINNKVLQSDYFAYLKNKAK